jgi:hypothetical protein
MFRPSREGGRRFAVAYLLSHKLRLARALLLVRGATRIQVLFGADLETPAPSDIEKPGPHGRCGR